MTKPTVEGPMDHNTERVFSSNEDGFEAWLIVFYLLMGWGCF